MSTILGVMTRHGDRNRHGIKTIATSIFSVNGPSRRTFLCRDVMTVIVTRHDENRDDAQYTNRVFDSPEVDELVELLLTKSALRILPNISRKWCL